MSENEGRKFYFGKLVRDETVPDYEQDKSVLAIDFHTMDPMEKKRALIEKIHEEADEIPLQAMSDEEVVAEIADARDVLKALAKAYGISERDISAASQKKAAKRGGFESGHYIETITVEPGSQWESYCLNDPEKYPEIIEG
ncbi:MAG: nucleoside triphosphate pyrophosphohydrolase [Candidatus Saccharimonadales bacterium]